MGLIKTEQADMAGVTLLVETVGQYDHPHTPVDSLSTQ